MLEWERVAFNETGSWRLHFDERPIEFGNRYAFLLSRAPEGLLERDARHGAPLGLEACLTALPADLTASLGSHGACRATAGWWWLRAETSTTTSGPSRRGRE